MATPLSKRIQQDRKSTFLDNISAQAVGEEQRKKEKKSREKSSESGGVGGGKGTKRKAGKTTAGAGSSGAAKKVSLCQSIKLSCVCTTGHSLVPSPILSFLACNIEKGTRLFIWVLMRMTVSASLFPGLMNPTGNKVDCMYL